MQGTAHDEEAPYLIALQLDGGKRVSFQGGPEYQWLSEVWEIVRLSSPVSIGQDELWHGGVQPSVDRLTWTGVNNVFKIQGHWGSCGRWDA